MRKLGNWEIREPGNSPVRQFPSFPISPSSYLTEGYPFSTPPSVTTTNRSVRASYTVPVETGLPSDTVDGAAGLSSGTCTNWPFDVPNASTPYVRLIVNP